MKNGAVNLFGLGFITILFLASSCSSLPKTAKTAVASKNVAAEYSAMADKFFQEGNYASALQFYGEAIDSALSVDDVAGGIKARNSIGRVYLAINRPADAEREFSDALLDSRQLGDEGLAALCLSNLGELRYTQNSYQEAEALFLEAESLAGQKGVASKPGNAELLAVIYHNKGVTAIALGRLDEAEALILKAAQSNEKAYRWTELGSNCYSLASLYNARGNLDTALAWAKKALDSDKKAENSTGIGADLEALSRLSERNGELGPALDYKRRAFGVWLSINRAKEAEACLNGLIRLSAALGEHALSDRYKKQLEMLKDYAENM